MPQEVIAFIGFFLGASWDFFTAVKVPGFDFTFAALFVGLFLATLSLRFLFAMLGVGLHSDVVTSIIEHKPQEKRFSGFYGFGRKR